MPAASAARSDETVDARVVIASLHPEADKGSGGVMAAYCRCSDDASAAKESSSEKNSRRPSELAWRKNESRATPEALLCATSGWASAA